MANFTRTFKQFGKGYSLGPGTVNITAQFEGNVVYQGAVATTNGAMPAQETFELPLTDDNVLFTWTQDSTMTGLRSMSIQVNGGSLYLYQTLTNYVPVQQTTDPPVWYPEGQGPDVFTVWSVTSVNGTSFVDPMSRVMLDGVPMIRDYDPSKFGQALWVIPDGSLFECMIDTTVVL